MMTTALPVQSCRYCGSVVLHTPERCSQVTAIDYHKNGSIKRVELGQRYTQWYYPIQSGQSYPNQITWTSSTTTS